MCGVGGEGGGGYRPQPCCFKRSSMSTTHSVHLGFECERDWQTLFIISEPKTNFIPNLSQEKSADHQNQLQIIYSMSEQWTFVLNCIALRLVVVDIFQTRSKVPDWPDCVAIPCTPRLPPRLRRLYGPHRVHGCRSCLPPLYPMPLIPPDSPFQKCPVSSSPLCSVENKCLQSIFEQRPPQAAQSRWSQTGLSLRTWCMRSTGLAAGTPQYSTIMY